MLIEDHRHGQLIEALAEARARTLLLISGVAEEDLRKQHSPLMGPILWDLGHIAEFEYLWLVLNQRGRIEFGEMPGLYNPFEHPRRVRGSLELPTLEATLQHLDDVRRQVLAVLDSTDFFPDDPLLRDGYVYRMVIQHEDQHQETMLQTLQLKQGEPYRAPRQHSPANGGAEFSPGEMVRFPGGEVIIGTSDRTAAYDNERPPHRVELPPFRIDRTPVTNGQYIAFIESGGYHNHDLWSEAGRAWLQEARVTAPLYWTYERGEWRTRDYDRTTAVNPDRPVCHVSYHEAEAYARWQGKRLPTEEEWEAAATWDPAANRKCAYPWGDEPPTAVDANLDQLMFTTAPIGSYPRNTSPIGCYGMIGDVWEWTATDFNGYPGFRMFPYPEYSEVFFGQEYKVLRGGSWATRSRVARSTFRNWDYPIRRQIFSGFRCARDDHN